MPGPGAFVFTEAVAEISLRGMHAFTGALQTANSLIKKLLFAPFQALRWVISKAMSPLALGLGAVGIGGTLAGLTALATLVWRGRSACCGTCPLPSLNPSCRKGPGTFHS